MSTLLCKVSPGQTIFPPCVQPQMCNTLPDNGHIFHAKLYFIGPRNIKHITCRVQNLYIHRAQKGVRDRTDRGRGGCAGQGKAGRRFSCVSAEVFERSSDTFSAFNRCRALTNPWVFIRKTLTGIRISFQASNNCTPIHVQSCVATTIAPTVHPQLIDCFFRGARKAFQFWMQTRTPTEYVPAAILNSGMSGNNQKSAASFRVTHMLGLEQFAWLSVSTFSIVGLSAYIENLHHNLKNIKLSVMQKATHVCSPRQC